MKLKSALIIVSFSLAACSAPAPAPVEVQSQAPAMQKPTVAAAKEAEVSPPPVPAPEAKPDVSKTKPVVIETKAVETKAPEPKPVTQVWRLKKGRLAGPGAWVAPKLMSKTKNEKTPGTTTENCFLYGEFAVIEMRSTDELGSAEIAIRRAPPGGNQLCATEFKGQTMNLRIIEGSFAGVAGGTVLVDGADSTEGTTEFQLFSVESGKELIKSHHHPSEEFAIFKKGDALSLEFFAKLDVKCELASEGEPCWKKVLAANRVTKRTPMPDCAAAFNASKTPLTEPALVMVPARVAQLGSSRVEMSGGRATCQPAP